LADRYKHLGEDPESQAKDEIRIDGAWTRRKLYYQGNRMGISKDFELD
jgi:hypothetical protein